MKAFLRKYLLTIGCGVAIFVLSVADFSSLPEENLPRVPYFDKWVHVGMYFLLGFVFCLDVRPFLFRTSIFVILLPVIYGGLLECVQQVFVPFRTGDWFDFLADAVGVITGFACCRFLFLKKWM